MLQTLLNIYYNDESHVAQPRQSVSCLVKIVQSTRHTSHSSHSQVIKRQTRHTVNSSHDQQPFRVT